MAKILVACEFSGIVRNAFLDRGHDAWSCDLLPTESRPNRHITGDVRDVMHEGWDCLIVAHPPCTRLCNSGVRWLTKPPLRRQPSYPAEYDGWTEAERLAWIWEDLAHGAALFSELWNVDIPHVCIENPIMHKHAKALIENYQQPAQTVQPWWFGTPQFKGTGLYLRNLPLLQETNRLTPPSKGTEEHKRWSRVHYMSPGNDRAKERSRFFPDIADAMADQWGPVIEPCGRRRAA
nr:hypothetical protein [uncultured Cohaesibacter sp.]